MDDDLKKKWIDALRSGNYVQGKAVLRNGEAFCCLGVLADIMGEKWDADGVATKFGRESEAAEFLNSDVLLYDDQIELAEYNDSGYSFSEIAYFIENEKMIEEEEEEDDNY